MDDLRPPMETLPGGNINMEAGPVAGRLFAEPPRYAGFLFRLLAFSADILFLFAFTCLTSGLLLNVGHFHSAIAQMAEPGILFRYLFLFQNVLSAAYFTLSAAVYGSTIGKRLAGIYVARENGSAISIPRAFLRYLSYYPGAMFFGLGFFLALIDPRGQALHDKISGTVVLEIE